LADHGAVTEIDWVEWSRSARRLMQARNDAFVAAHELTDAPYRWNLQLARIGFMLDPDAVLADICVVGSVSAQAGTFLWGWANEAVPPAATARLEAVRAFGLEHGLHRLSTPEWVGGVPDGLEMLAIAGRLLDATAVWIERDGDRTIFFTLHGVRREPLSEHGWLLAH
jgi:hypothetical protein